jgi:nitrate reductase alpha subunit
MSMRLFSLSVVLFFSSCQKSPALIPSVDAPSFRSPTATEVFNLRSKCAELGEKILKNTVIGDALKKDQLSHYEPKTNRCYVQLTVWNANLAKGDEYFQQDLLDGQTGQVLAAIRRKNGLRSGDISIDPSPLNGNSDELYVDASMFISKMMADDRQQ